ncbi:MAG: hypothetical protein MN733_15550, partial [Nitrososphaera sp.]|nr:hypothetical protein [Nitrososphaera sp.]
MADTLTIDLYYSRRFPKSSEYVKKLSGYLQERGLRHSIFEVEDSFDYWKATGLRSVPSLMFRIDGEPVSNLVKYAPFEDILKRAEVCRGGMPPKKNVHTPVLTVDSPIKAGCMNLPFTITRSSGCHRYERWNEHFLAYDYPQSGWACPGMKGQKEYLEIDFQSVVNLHSVHIGSRVRNDGTP